MRVRGRAASKPARGFSLIELLLVLVILAALAAVVVPKFTRRSEQARVTAAATEIRSLETALDMFQIDCGRFPSTEEGLKALTEKPGDLIGWKEPYLKREVSTDPWGNAYVYRHPGTHNDTGYDLHSFGPDGQDGGGDDIDNWSSAKK